MKYKRLYIAAILIVFILGIIPYKEDINVTSNNMVYRNFNSNYKVPCSVEIKGKYYRSLLRKDEFKGNVILRSDEFNYKTLDIELMMDEKQAMLFEPVEGNGMGNPTHIGFIFCDSVFDNFLIILNDVNEQGGRSIRGDTALFISIPSSTRPESIEVAELISKQNSWFSQNPWE